MTRLNHLHLPNPDLQVRLHTRHTVVADAVKEHVRERLARSSRYGIVIDSVDVRFILERNPRQGDHAHRVEVTGYGVGVVVRAEAAGSDWLTAFDACLDRWHERLRRSSERRAARRKGRFGHAVPAAVTAALPQPEDSHAAVQGDAQPPASVIAITNEQGQVRSIGQFLVREKTHASAPMSVADAIDAMELVGHEFFAFIDDETGQFSVVYQRRAFTYGLIRLSPA
ncbi:MAG: ribosome-associated translation inhibitor RaiA [Actinomycetales bacterium]|nr:ribosome-associated translation inhibitor RaiA [Actinomycetales bacterium]